MCGLANIHHFLLLFIAAPSLFAYESILNGGFENSELSPWFQDRSFGLFRSWLVGSHEPAEGFKTAFCLGRVELRQNLSPVPAREISQFTFEARQQFVDKGPFWLEVFYLDGTSTGFIEIALEGKFIWQTIDVLPLLDQTKVISGISIFGIPDNTLVIDNFRIVSVNEKFSIGTSANKAILSWFGRQGNSYEILYSPDLQTWSVAESFAMESPGIRSFEWTTNEEKGFFRLNIIETSSE